MLYLINDSIQVILDEGHRRKWYLDIKYVTDIQLEGFPVPDGISENLQTVILKDYEFLDLSNAESIVPGAYVYKENILIDLQKRIALRITNNTVEYWCHSSYNLPILFLIQLLLIRKGETFIHAAGISVEGEGVLLSAFGGIGKTLLVSSAVKKAGVGLLGDDFVILSRNGIMQPYLRPFCLYHYHKMLFPEFYALHNVRYRKIPIPWKAFYKAKKKLYYSVGRTVRTNKYATPYGYITVPPAQLFHKKYLETGSLPLKKVFLLRRTAGVKGLKVKKVNAKKAIPFFAAGVTYHEWDASLKFLFSYLIHTHQSISKYLNQAEEYVLSALEDVEEAHAIDIPASYSLDRLVSEVLPVIL